MAISMKLNTEKTVQLAVRAGLFSGHCDSLKELGVTAAVEKAYTRFFAGGVVVQVALARKDIIDVMGCIAEPEQRAAVRAALNYAREEFTKHTKVQASTPQPPLGNPYFAGKQSYAMAPESKHQGGHPPAPTSSIHEFLKHAGSAGLSANTPPQPTQAPVNPNEVGAAGKPAKSGPVPLVDASEPLQPVKGTNDNSLYYALALDTDLKVAIRYRNATLSMRLEGNWGKLSTKDMALLGIAKHAGKGYASGHWNVASPEIAVRTVGAMLAALGHDFERVGNIKKTVALGGK